jgi:2-oxoglutarate ferredoxin oxidoreductase subunit alpha
MVEALGQAGMTETPIVIIESQRAGPSTGLPTKTEQGDLNMFLGASQGDFPRIVIAPSTVEDAFYATAEAFNLAEKYQCPVIVASDLLLSEHIETVDALDLNVPIDRGLMAQVQPGEKYLRYKVTDTGVSPRALPGQEGLMFVAASDEHDEAGVVISDVLAGLPVYTKVRERIMEKRMKKLDYARMDIKPPSLIGDDNADLTIVCWGSTFGAVSDAIGLLTNGGKKLNCLVFRDLWPFKAEESEKLLQSARRLLLVENNFTGQLGRLIRSETGIKIGDRLLKYDGEPFYPSEIVSKAQAMLS